jgi:hypothetical protein
VADAGAADGEANDGGGLDAADAADAADAVEDAVDEGGE